jgi:hypothetical protein
VVRQKSPLAAAWPIILALAWLCAASRTNAQVNVTTYHNDNSRTGANLSETALTPANVNVNAFGKLFSQPVDSYIVAQPLFLSGVAIPNKGTHNVVYVATENDSVYAFDSDSNSGANASPLWKANLLPVGAALVSSADVGNGDFGLLLGIVGTPVIDAGTGTLYAVAKYKASGGFFQSLHALDVHTGAEKPGSPVVLQGSVPGTGDGSVNGTVTFNPLRQMQRPALLLNNGILYIAFSSHGDIVGAPDANHFYPEGYHGWVFAYNASTLQQIALFNTTPNARTDPSGYPLAGGGIWMAGGGPAADAQGNVYFMTGNGSFSASAGGKDYGDSFVKLNGANLGVLDYFTPFDQDNLNRTDSDLGSGGVLLLPDQPGPYPHLLVGCGKEGRIYLLNRDNGGMGGYHSGDNVVQSISHAIAGVWGMPAFFNNTLYYGGVGDAVKAFSLLTTPTANLNFANGFSGSAGLTYNGSAYQTGSRIVLNDSVNQAGSAFANDTVNVSQFQAAFHFQISNGTGDGITFCLAGGGPNALGSAGGNLGYTGVANSVCVKFDTVNNAGEGTNSTGIYTNGVTPYVPAVNLTGTGINLQSGHIFAVTMNYNGTTLAVTIQDTATNATATQSYPINIPSVVGNAFGYAGFTGGTGGSAANQEILDWTYTAPAIPAVHIDNTPVSQSATTYLYPGTTPSISANGSAADPASTGIVWTLESALSGQAVLHAYAATDLSHELYNSAASPGRDDAGGYVKFTTPTIANGKVYVGTQAQVTVYGNGQFVNTPVITPPGGNFYPSVTVTITEDTPGAEIHVTTDGSAPTQSSPLYAAPFTLTQSATVQARAYKIGSTSSAPVQAFFLIDQGPGDGDGLQATYFHNMDFSGTTYSEVDPTINFNWAGGSPAPGIGGQYWAARWVGKVQPRSTGAYTFTAVVDDGARLWVNNQQIINAWLYQSAPTAFSGSIALTAGQLYDIQLEYFQGGGGSSLKLYWAAPGQAYQIVPQSQLYSGQTPTAATPQFLPDSGTFFPSVTVALTESTYNAEVHYTLDGTEPMQSSPLYAAPLALNATTTVKAKAFKTGYNPSATGVAVYTYNPNIASPIYAINSGGPAIPPFSADMLFNDGAGHTRVGAVDTGQVPHPAPMEVYQSERLGNFNYTLPGLVPGQAYTVRLHFAENVMTDVNERLFNVAINGQQVLSNFDVFAEAGGQFKAIVREFIATADSTGSIVITFSTVVFNAKVSAIEVFLAPGAVSGKITLEGCVNSAQPLTFAFRPTGGGAALTFTQTLATDGSFSLSGIPIGTYNLAVKGSRWLQKVVKNISVSANGASGVNVTLPAGDINNDNKVDILDLSLLADAYNATPASPKWNANADLNGDGKVNIVDLGLLANNFGKSGDP